MSDSLMASVWPQTMSGGTHCPAADEAEDLLLAQDETEAH